jgi:hypothetical protein
MAPPATMLVSGRSIASHRGVTVMASNPEQLYSLKPIVDALRSRGATVRLAAPSGIAALAAEYLNVPQRNVLNLEGRFPVRWSIRHGVAWLLARYFVFARVPRDFSVMYRRVRSSGRFAERLLGWFPSVKPTRVNAAYHALFDRWLPNIFGRDMVLASTPVTHSHLLCARGVRVCTIIDSWDHSFKMPLLHEPVTTFAWNDDLAAAVREYQRIDHVRSIFPLRFRYIEELADTDLHAGIHCLSNPVFRSDLEAIGNDGFVCYVATSSSRNPSAFQGELALVKDIRDYCAEHHIRLYIKPKPNGMPDEFAVFAGDAAVQIGPYGTGSSNLQLLDAEYHLYRYALLKQARLVINVGTTFGLEASLVGAAVLQLRLDNRKKFGAFQELCSNPHVVRYFLADRPYRTYTGSRSSMEKLFEEAMTSSVARDYSAGLRQWIRADHTLADSVELVADTVMRCLCDDIR